MAEGRWGLECGGEAAPLCPPGALPARQGSQADDMSSQAAPGLISCGLTPVGSPAQPTQPVPTVEWGTGDGGPWLPAAPPGSAQAAKA